VTETRCCEECGTSFVPLREHARFCSAGCRVAWNRQNRNDQAAEECALDWSGAAMLDATQRLARERVPGRRHAYVIISEAVWWVTIVDATLVRYHPDTYDAVLAAQPAAERGLTEGTLAGLRFVRNEMGYYTDHSDFVQPSDDPDGRQGRGAPVSGWTWRPLPGPGLTQLPPPRQEWEMARYREYQAHLAGRTMGEVFGRAASFLALAAGQSAGAQPQPSISNR
jgi:hypothetical protein